MARPTEYDPSYCEQVIAWGTEGKSVTWMAAHLGVCKQTLHNWAQAHPEFLDAFTRARLLCQAWWEDQGQAGMYAPGFNGSVWAKNMGARFKDEWGDSNKVELTGANGGAVQSHLTITFEDGSNKPAE